MKPLLAATVTDENIKRLKYPLLASPKIDGIRCLVTKYGGVTRNLKLIPNLHIRNLLMTLNNFNLDGELTAGINFQNTTSFVMSHDKVGNFDYNIFDIVDTTIPFILRFELLRSLSTTLPSWVQLVPHTLIYSYEDLVKFEQDCLIKGYEGIILRSLDGIYKFGRSTFNEGILLKLKRFSDSEAKVIGFNPLYENVNEPVTNKLGYSERSSRQEGKVVQETLGSLVVSWEGLSFSIGSGFTEEQRYGFWKDRYLLFGKTVKFKYQKLGMKDLPRFPVFLCFRDEIDY